MSVGLPSTHLLQVGNLEGVTEMMMVAEGAMGGSGTRSALGNTTVQHGQESMPSSPVMSNLIGHGLEQAQTQKMRRGLGTNLHVVGKAPLKAMKTSSKCEPKSKPKTASKFKIHHKCCHSEYGSASSLLTWALQKEEQKQEVLQVFFKLNSYALSSSSLIPFSRGWSRSGKHNHCSFHQHHHYC